MLPGGIKGLGTIVCSNHINCRNANKSDITNLSDLIGCQRPEIGAKYVVLCLKTDLFLLLNECEKTPESGPFHNHGITPINTIVDIVNMKSNPSQLKATLIVDHYLRLIKREFLKKRLIELLLKMK